MSRTQSPVRVQSPSLSMEELLSRMLTQIKALAISFGALKRENKNRVEEISKLAKKVGFSGEIETDKENVKQPEETNDSSSE